MGEKKEQHGKKKKKRAKLSGGVGFSSLLLG